MKIGFVGCGKLGLMVALSIESRGHEVKGYDVNPAISDYLKNRKIPFREENSEELLSTTKMEMVDISELCSWADILFLAPQTPHAPEFEGDVPLPLDRSDFDYGYLKSAVFNVNQNLVKPTICVIISTVLPGTIERDVVPFIGANFRLVYEPLFIAMGTVYQDFLNPEFVLMGVHQASAAAELRDFYKTIHDKPAFLTDVRTAEGIKVFYNTAITCKTVLGNIYGELAHRLNMNVDDIFNALSMATDRIISPKYLQAGMGDGGGCHPRDNIALSWLARDQGLSYDLFSSLMTAREEHVRWLARMIDNMRGNLPVFILGLSFKPETDIRTGSPSVLLSHILKEMKIDHLAYEDLTLDGCVGLYFIGTKHKRYQDYKFPAGSIVIDPFRYINMQDGVTLLSIGNGDSKKYEKLGRVVHT